MAVTDPGRTQARPPTRTRGTHHSSMRTGPQGVPLQSFSGLDCTATGLPEQRRVVATTEVMVNGPYDVSGRGGSRGWRTVCLRGEGGPPRIEPIVAPLGLRVDAESRWVDARLPDGSRVQTRFLCALSERPPTPGPGRGATGRAHPCAHVRRRPRTKARTPPQDP
jgi:hypothetical protein